MKKLEKANKKSIMINSDFQDFSFLVKVVKKWKKLEKTVKKPKNPLFGPTIYQLLSDINIYPSVSDSTFKRIHFDTPIG